MESTETASRAEWIRAVLERHEGALVRYALSLTGDLETARDVTQDTFLRLCEQPPGAVDGHLVPWLFTVCRNRALDVQRKDSRMIALDESELDRRPASGRSPADLTADRESSARVDELLADLPFNQREVVRLKFQQQLSYDEIAAVTALSASNVGFLLHTALRTLRQRMAKLERLSPAP